MLPVRQRSRRARHEGLLQPSLTSLVSYDTALLFVTCLLSFLHICLPTAGVWVKDTDASDTESYNRALDIMKLGAMPLGCC